MALYDSNQKYTCKKCGFDLFKEEEVFLIEIESDKSKLNAPVSLKKKAVTKRVVCKACGAIVVPPVE